MNDQNNLVSYTQQMLLHARIDFHQNLLPLIHTCLADVTFERFLPDQIKKYPS